MNVKMEQILASENVPQQIYLQNSTSNDPFFESLALGFNNIRPDSKTTAQNLREECERQARNVMENDKTGLINILQERQTFTNILEYIHKIRCTGNEQSEINFTEFILAVPDIKAQFICQKFEISVHVMEFNETQNTCVHKIINSTEIKLVDNSCVSYTNNNCIHILQLNLNEYYAMLKKEEKPAGTAKRPGTTNKGLDYETTITAMMAAKCALNEEIKDFSINSNLDGYGALDDIILSIIMNNGQKNLFLFQLKHKQKSTNFLDAIDVKGMFSLKKYEESYLKLKSTMLTANYDNIYIILFTNCQLTGKTPPYILPYTENNFITDLIKTKPTSKFYKITSGYDENFLSTLFIVSEQVNAKEVNGFLKTEITVNFDLSSESTVMDQLALDNFQKYIKHWNENVITITRDKTRSLLYESMLHLYIPDFITDNQQTNLDILVETCNNFNCTIINTDNSKTILLAICEYLIKQFKLNNLKLKSFSTSTKDYYSDLFKYYKYKKHFKELNNINGDLTLKDLYLIMCRCKKIPLLLKYNTQNKCIIDLVVQKLNDIYENRSLILIKDEICETKFYKNSFLNLHLLIERNPELYDKNIQHIQLTFASEQHKIRLKNLLLVCNETSIVNKINPNVYVKLISKTICIGQKCDIPNYYIERSLRLPIVEASVFNEIDLFLLINASSTDGFYKFKNVLNSNATFEETKQLAKSIFKMTNRTCHILSKIDDNTFLKMFTKGSVENISKYQIKNKYPEESIKNEDDILCYLKENRQQIISCDAGMGKSTFLKRVQNLESKEQLSIYINLAKHASIIREINDLNNDINIILKILENTSEYVFDLQKTIFMELLKNGKVTWLIDAFDEVDTTEIKRFLNCIKNSQNKIIIATRSSKLAEIETNFNIFSLDLVPFTKSEQIKFFTKYFKNKFSEEQIITHLNNLSKLEETLIGIPLQTKLCAELLEELTDVKQNDFTIVFLFEHFLEKIFKNRDAEYENRVSKLALKLFFDEELLNTVGIYNIDLQVMIKSIKESEINDFLISGFNELDDPIFTHRSYAEYLCAKWLFKNLQSSETAYKNIYSKIFCNSLIQVRILFDKIVCSKLKLHTAVLNADIQTTKDLLKDNKELINETDEFGRTALYLASSYGKRIYLNTKEGIKGIKTEHENVKVETLDNIFNLQLIKLSMSNNNLLDTTSVFDYIFNYDINKILEPDIIEYSLQSSSYDLANKLCTKFKPIKSCDIVSDEYNIMLCYIAVTYNLNNLFEYILPSMKNICTYYFNKKNLFFVAVENENYEIMKILNDIGVNIEEKYNGKTVLQLSCENGKLPVIKLLIEFGANFENKTDDGKNIVELAQKNGHIEVVEYLKNELFNKFNIRNTPLHEAAAAGYLERCKKILDDYDVLDLQNDEGYTPLMYAAENGHLGITDLLISEGADCFLCNGIGKNSLKLAFENGHISIIKLKSIKLIFKQLIKIGDINRLKELINLGFDIESTYNYNSALHVAVELGTLEVVKLLVESGANYKKLGWNANSTLLHTAILSDHRNVWEYVLNLGFDLEVRNNLNATPLHVAACNGKLHSLNWLIEKGANYKAPGWKNQNLLHSAALSDNIDLLERVYGLGGFDINGQNLVKGTPLHNAAYKENLVTVEWLLSHGADANIRNISGEKAEDKTDNRTIKRILRRASTSLVKHSDIINF